MNKTRQVWAAPVRFCARASSCVQQGRVQKYARQKRAKDTAKLAIGCRRASDARHWIWLLGKAVMDGELDGDCLDGGGGGPKRMCGEDSGCAIPRALICSATISTFNVASGPPGQSARAELVCAGAGDRIIMGEDLEAREAEKHTQPTTPYLGAANHRTRTHLGSILRDIAP